MLHVKNLLALLVFPSFKHSSLSYFCSPQLVHLHFKLLVGNTTICSGGFSTLIGLCCCFYNTVTYFIINVTIHPASRSAPMETIECLIFRKICACIAVLGSIGKYNSSSVVDLIIFPLVNFTLIIFVVGRTSFMWEDNAIELPVHHESATTEFPCSISFIIVVVGA